MGHQNSEYSARCPEKTYDLISCNNTLLYINSVNEKIQTMKNFYSILKPKGIIITDNYCDGYPTLSLATKLFAEWFKVNTLKNSKSLPLGFGRNWHRFIYIYLFL